MIKNYTGHMVKVITTGGTVEFPAEGDIRLTTDLEVNYHEPDFSLDPERDIPVMKKVFREKVLPGKVEGTMYIVSTIVALAFPDRDDLLAPADTVRDFDGNVIGCRALCFMARED